MDNVSGVVCTSVLLNVGAMNLLRTLEILLTIPNYSLFEGEDAGKHLQFFYGTIADSGELLEMDGFESGTRPIDRAQRCSWL